MKPPVTPKPMPASSPNLPTNYTRKLFRIVYIILTGVVDTIVPVAGPWSWVGKSASYLLNLAPLLWWALPAKTLTQVTPRNSRPATQDWVSDTDLLSCHLTTANSDPEYKILNTKEILPLSVFINQISSTLYNFPDTFSIQKA
ncbi:hypothetical protein DSO57_1011336 [Entomophthora muscae]|uniref:Uncharacterized protein n=1 Tax=Entomophthora muscae TaxID=34485 RepID=A0ACC2U498_9FUNG|nr:hypothetical protein DSO57_1011336 [Entomophthora muscae]